MPLKKLSMVPLVALSFVTALSTTSTTASAHGYGYWLRPHWVTIKKTTTIAKIKNTYPLSNSYKVDEWIVYPGYHLKVHHGASYLWLGESGKFNTGPS
ncbi:hypothetical protein HC026_09315 [Lactobacillus sp. LC28-10]|uniref:Uncharacterized protein n=1 Tax=Secundilactobacillus angelensis TaxID=2722706 RepID=A0ABX1KYS7_9LACO|nr:hypothetical protein [Secundilactobacillus angelensis]MCH5462737.1 hypothetical protein [Secundilactobacillus angelensis]NLR19109.1 hypothetical protein [Secundilactobacillus angelensis]